MCPPGPVTDFHRSETRLAGSTAVLLSETCVLNVVCGSSVVVSGTEACLSVTLVLGNSLSVTKLWNMNFCVREDRVTIHECV